MPRRPGESATRAAPISEIETCTAFAFGFVLVARLGPILAAVFMTVWEIFGAAFGDVIPVAPPIALTDGHAAEAPGTVIITPSEHVPEA